MTRLYVCQSLKLSDRGLLRDNKYHQLLLDPRKFVNNSMLACDIAMDFTMRLEVLREKYKDEPDLLALVPDEEDVMVKTQLLHLGIAGFNNEQQLSDLSARWNAKWKVTLIPRLASFLLRVDAQVMKVKGAASEAKARAAQIKAVRAAQLEKEATAEREKTERLELLEV